MKKLGNFINLSYFDYRKEVGERIFEKSLCTYFDKTMVIYTNDPAIKYHLNSIKKSLLDKAKMYKEELEKIEIKDDKKGYIFNRNNNLKNKPISKEEYEKNKEGIERVLNRAKKNIEEESNDEIKIFFEASLKRLEDSYDKNKVVCKNCGYKFSPVSICPICFFYAIDDLKARAIKEILKDPYILNSSDIYIDARNKLYLDKKYAAMNYITDNYGKIKSDILLKYLVEAVIYLTGSRDRQIINLGVEKLKGEIREYGTKNGYTIDI